MSTIIPLEEKELPDTCFVFKHSNACPISWSAAERVKAFTTEQPIYWINVIEQRRLSNWVADKYGVPHQSPQLLFIEDGLVKHDWHHQGITEEEVQKQLG